MQAVLTCAQMRAADKHTIEDLGVPSEALMERAGAAVAEEAEKLLRACGGKKVLAVCGVEIAESVRLPSPAAAGEGGAYVLELIPQGD